MQSRFKNVSTTKILIIKLDKKTRTIKMSLLADDTKQEIFIAVNEIEIFGSLSGLNLNWK